MSVATHGLTHVALAVRDPQRSMRFYQEVLGVVPVYESDDFVQVQTGSRDVIVFERQPSRAGKSGGVVHFGFRLQRPEDIQQAIEMVRHAGGAIQEQGEFVPGEPYVFFSNGGRGGNGITRRNGGTEELIKTLRFSVPPC